MYAKGFFSENARKPPMVEATKRAKGQREKHLPEPMNEKNNPPTKEDVTEWLTEHGDLLYRYAMKRIGKSDVAEDLVQDTFVAALRSADGFEGRSKVQTWLVGILRHKIADHLRKVSRQRQRDAKTREDASHAEVFQQGHWRVGVKPWTSDPAKSLENEEFWTVLSGCQEKLPDKLSMAFRMRDIEDLPMAEICELLEITATNLSVRLHRARVLLRECLDQNWFSAQRHR